MTTSPAFQSQAELKPLLFDPSKLNGLSERLIRSHWENNYGGSVKVLANVKSRLAQAATDKDLPPYVYNNLKREHLSDEDNGCLTEEGNAARGAPRPHRQDARHHGG